MTPATQHKQTHPPCLNPIHCLLHLVPAISRLWFACNTWHYINLFWLIDPEAGTWSTYPGSAWLGVELTTVDHKANSLTTTLSSHWKTLRTSITQATHAWWFQPVIWSEAVLLKIIVLYQLGNFQRDLVRFCQRALQHIRFTVNPFIQYITSILSLLRYST